MIVELLFKERNSIFKKIKIFRNISRSFAIVQTFKLFFLSAWCSKTFISSL